MLIPRIQTAGQLRLSLSRSEFSVAGRFGSTIMPYIYGQRMNNKKISPLLSLSLFLSTDRPVVASLRPYIILT